LGWNAGVFSPSLNGLTISFPFNSNTNVSVYPVEPSVRLPEGGIEYDIQLLKKPAQNYITLNIDWQGITWQKILPLNMEYSEARCEDVFGLQGAPYTITATSIIGTDGITYKTRPEYEVNSYLGTAVAPTTDTDVIGWNETTQQPITYSNVSRTYLYIHRGQMTDALGNKAWVEDINFDEVDKTITFTLPAVWMRNATYPVSQVCGVDPAYTQDLDYWDSTDYGGSDGVWGNYDLYTNKGVPKGATAEIIVANIQTGVENRLGVRTDGSSLNRHVQQHEAEGGGETHCRIFATCHATTGLIECYHSDVSDDDLFYLVGYWENVTFTEDWNITYSTTGDWQTRDMSSSYADKVLHCLLENSEADTANSMGVRAVGSSLDRQIYVHEPESGGESHLDMFVKADSSGDLQVTNDDTGGSNYIRIAGYFGSEMDFVEKWQAVTFLNDSWYNVDLSAYMDVDGRMVDVLCTNTSTSATKILGVRNGDDTTLERSLTEHEDEGDSLEYTGFGMSAQSNSSGIVKFKGNASWAYYYHTGYFKPASSYSISNDPSTEALGLLAVNTTYYAFGSAPSNPVGDAECTFILTNAGIQCDLDMHVDDFTGGVGWNIDATPEANEVKITAYYGGQNPASGLVLTNADQEFYDALGVGAHIHWDFALLTGSSFTDGVAKSATLTITAVAED